MGSGGIRGTTSHSKLGVMAAWAQEGLEEFKVRRLVSNEIYFVQGEEQWLRFAGAAVKSYHRFR